MALETISVALQKGGVGKTTVAVNLTERFAARGLDAVLIDLDQQGIVISIRTQVFSGVI